MDQFIMPPLAYSSTFVGILDEYRFGLNHESPDDWLAWRYPRYGTEHILFLLRRRGGGSVLAAATIELRMDGRSAPMLLVSGNKARI